MRFLLHFATGVLFASSFSTSLRSAVTPLVSHGDVWYFHKGTNAPQSDWKTAADAALTSGQWSASAGGFGYGTTAQETNNCRTILTDMAGSAATNYTTVYMRRTFTISSPVATNLHVFLRMDWDDGYIAWLDGTYLIHTYSPGAPAEPPYSTNATTSHECSTGQTGSPAVTNDLGLVGSRLGLGDHVLAIIGLNQSKTSGDFIQVADLFLDTVTEPPAVTNGVGGTLAADTTWYATNSPYNVTSTVTVASNVTLTIEPGVSVRFNTGSGLTVRGRLLAAGTSNAPISFTNAVAGGRWGRLQFLRAADSLLRYCDIQRSDCAGDHQDYYDNDCNTNTPPLNRSYHEAIVALATHLDIEYCVFRNLLGGSGGNEGDALAIVSDDPQVPGTASANVRFCRFDGIGQGVHTRFAYVLVEGCYFVNKHGDNDDVDLYGESTPPPLILNNMFAAPCHEDRINPTRCSAIIIGNVIAVSDDHGIVLRDRGSPIMINNLVYNCANGGISVQNTCDALILNTTIVNCGRAFRFFDHFDRHGPPYCLIPGSGRARIINCIVWDCPESMLLTDSTNGHSYAAVAYCDIEGGRASATVSANSTLVWDASNFNLDPQFVNLAATNLHLTGASPCIDAGTNFGAIVTNDFDGLPRPLDGNGVSGAALDIGAYEFLLPTADSNGDGIPDGWTLRYGFNPTEPGVGSGNPDGDPHTTHEEWVADTDPTNALSYLRVTGVSNGPPLSVQFLSSTNRQYTLFRTADFAGAGWTGVPGQTNLPGAGGPMILSDTNESPQGFYKVGVRVP